jgi:tight adherence protein B
MRDPIGTELGITADEMTFGQDVVTAVSNLYRRVGQEDLVFLAIAVSVQSQTGGNLADVLARLATLMRERVTMRLKIKALSAEGRLSGWFLSAMPFILFGAIQLVATDYFGGGEWPLSRRWSTGSHLCFWPYHLSHGEFQGLAMAQGIFYPDGSPLLAVLVRHN